MGERLNIEIKKGNKALANSYYHWSAYSESAIILTDVVRRTLCSFKCNKENYFTDLEQAVIALYLTGAGIEDREFSYAKKQLKEIAIIKAINRTEGLIALTEKGINITRSYEEGRVEIDIDKLTFTFEVYDCVNFKDYQEWHGELRDYIPPEELPVLDFSFENIPLTENNINKIMDMSFLG